VFRLEKGATSFHDPKDSPLPKTDVRALRSAWHTAARLARGQVGEFAEQKYPQTFHNATVTNRDGLHVILCHAHFPLVAFVADQQYWYVDEFRDAPPWSSAFTDAGFVVMSAQQLNSPLADAETSALSVAEWRQIRHWRVTSLGGVLFNSWD
jgi:hypothetical protein